MARVFVFLLVVLFGCLCSVGECCGQIKTSVTFSNPWVNQVKKVNEDRKEYKKYVNDSLKNLKKLSKYYKHRFDSLAETLSEQSKNYTFISPTDLATLGKLKKLEAEYRDQKDSLSSIHKDSLAVDYSALEEMYAQRQGSIRTEINKLTEKHGGVSFNQITPYKNMNLDSLGRYQTGMDSIPDISIDSLKYYSTMRDSMLMVQMTEYVEDYAYSIAGIDELQMEQQRMLAEQDRLDAYKADFNRYRDKKNLKNNLQKLSRSELLSKNKTLNNAHRTLSTYKRKYLSLPSSSNLEGGVKRTSLENKTFWERIKVGGNLRISQREYLDIDFAPSIAYLANTKWSIGTEFVFRGEFGNGRKWHSLFDSDTYGGRVFTDYQVYKSFFAHAEFENLYTSRKTRETSTTQSVPGAMAGMGKYFGLGKNIQGKVLIQYNLIHDERKRMYTSPWVVRFGFDVKELKRKNKI